MNGRPHLFACAVAIILEAGCTIIAAPAPRPQGPAPQVPPPASLSSGPGPMPAPGSACASWRQTGACSAMGPREPGNDKSCDFSIERGWSGFCECAGGGVVGADCGHAVNNCYTVCSQLSWSAPTMYPPPQAGGACLAWRQTGACRAIGPREPSNDKSCSASIEPGWSGFCECASGAQIGADCGHPLLSCAQACAKGAWR